MGSIPITVLFLNGRWILCASCPFSKLSSYFLSYYCCFVARLNTFSGPEKNPVGYQYIIKVIFPEWHIYITTIWSIMILPLLFGGIIQIFIVPLVSISIFDVGFIFSPITVFSVLITIGFFDILILFDEFFMLYRVIKTNMFVCFDLFHYARDIRHLVSEWYSRQSCSILVKKNVKSSLRNLMSSIPFLFWVSWAWVRTRNFSGDGHWLYRWL
jgi:hypothetical protein